MKGKEDAETLQKFDNCAAKTPVNELGTFCTARLRTTDTVRSQL